MLLLLFCFPFELHTHKHNKYYLRVLNHDVQYSFGAYNVHSLSIEKIVFSPRFPLSSVDDIYIRIIHHLF